jgi:hypothetical protein
MLKVLFENPDESMSSDDIALYNIKISDMYYNKETLYFASIAWLLNDKNRTILDIELLYRNHNLNSYVISKNITIEKNLKLRCNDKMNLTYMFDVICKPKEISLKELEEKETYEENFMKLNNTGYLDFEDDTKFSDHIEKLLKNQIILKFVKYTAKESIMEIMNDLKSSLGYSPKIELIGNYNEEIPLMGFKTTEGKIASNIGWTVEKNDEETIYTLHNLNDIIAKN